MEIVIFNGLIEALNIYPILKIFYIQKAGDSYFQKGLRAPHKVKAKIIIALSDGKPMGWAWVASTTYPYYRVVEELKPLRRKAVDFMLWVHPDHRRKGVGTALCQQGQELSRFKKAKFICHPWNHPSRIFFKKNCIKNRRRGDSETYYFKTIGKL